MAYQRPQPSSAIQLVALHGALGSAENLASLLDKMPEQDLLLLDLPGHGQAPHSPGGYTAEALAEAIEAAVAQCCDARPIVILAVSFSGLAALHLAGRRSGISDVILIDTPLDTARMASSQKLVGMKWMNHPENREMLADLGRDFFGVDFERKVITRRTYYHYFFQCPANITMITGTVKTDTNSGAGAFYSQQDMEVLRTHRRFALTQVRGAGHAVFRMSPDLVVQIVSQVMAGAAHPGG